GLSPLPPGHGGRQAVSDRAAVSDGAWREVARELHAVVLSHVRAVGDGATGDFRARRVQARRPPGGEPDRRARAPGGVGAPGRRGVRGRRAVGGPDPARAHGGDLRMSPSRLRILSANLANGLADPDAFAELVEAV